MRREFFDLKGSEGLGAFFLLLIAGNGVDSSGIFICSDTELSSGDGGILLRRLDLLDIGVSSEGLTEWIFLLFFAAGTGVTLTRKTPTRLAAGATLDAALNTADPTTAACFLLFFSLLKPQYRCGLLTFLTVLLAALLPPVPYSC